MVKVIRRHARVQASAPQVAFANHAAPFPAFVGGFGSGKTHAGILRALRLKMAYPKQDIAYYLPTYDLVRLIGYPRFEAELQRLGVKYKLNKSDHALYLKGRGSLLFRTLSEPEKIVGYEVADSVVDELDTLPPAAAAHAWNQIIARNRQKKPDGSINSVAVATTPEGFRFVYNRWAKHASASYQIVQAPTVSNKRNLPADYISRLEETYPANLLRAYLNGEFVNLASGNVYEQFNRLLNGTDEVARHGEELHIGMDFNVMKMSAVVHVIREGKPYAVDEFMKVRDTPAMIQAIRQRYQSNRIVVYPDASGRNTSSKNASESDLSLLRNAGFYVDAPEANPPVRDRVMSLQAMICNIKQERRYRVNTSKCPTTTEALEQQPYASDGSPDKKAGFDHPCDAAGYFVHRRYPIHKPFAGTAQVVGH